MRVRNIKIVMLISLLSISFMKCGVKNKTVKTPEVKNESTQPAKTDFTPFINQIIKYKTFDGKADVEFSSKQMDQSGSIALKMIKDRETWASVRAIGGFIEVAQALATPDSLYAIQRLSRSYYAVDFEEGTTLINTPIRYDMLQNLLIGNPVFTPNIKDFTYLPDKVIATVQDFDYVVHLVYDIKTKLLISQEVKSKKSLNDFISCIYSDYTMTDIGFNFPKKRIIKAQQKSNVVNATLSFNSIVFDKGVDIKFNKR